MISVRASEHIQAPIEDVFAFMNEPSNQAVITPSLVESREVGREPNGGARADYRYKMAGMTFSGQVRAEEFVPEEKIVFAMKGDIKGQITWLFLAENGGTRVTYSADYEVPGAFLSRLAEPVAAHYNRREIGNTLLNLKDIVENGG